MSIFNRRKKQSSELNLPPEIQAYTQAEHRERVGMAWLVGIVSLVITLGVLSGMFFGGRWMYRKIADGNNGTTSVTENTKKDQSKKADDKKNNDSKKDGSASSDHTDAPTPVPSPPPTPAPQPTPAPSPALVRTGPDEDL